MVEGAVGRGLGTEDLAQSQYLRLPVLHGFRSKAVILADIAFRSPRVENHDEEKSDEARELEINCAEEQRLDTCTRMAKYLEGLRRYYNCNVKDRFFLVGDLVLCRK
jgi:hypothetical protein